MSPSYSPGKPRRRPRLSSHLAAAACLLLASGLPTDAGAGQDTRAGQLQAEREEKQKKAEEPQPNFLESALKSFEAGGVPLITRDGIYAKLGSITTGSGFAYGAGYRTQRFLDRDTGVDVWGGYSFKGYWAAQARIQAPLGPRGRLMLDAWGRRHEYPQEDYFGLGPDSARSAQTDFAMRQTAAGARLRMRLAPVVFAGGGAEYIHPSVGNGTDKALPSIGDVFDESSAPGLSTQPDFVRTLAFVDIDWRQPRYPRRGGWYHVELSHYEDRDRGLYSFNRVDIDLRQYVSFLSERRVFVGRAWISTSDTKSGETMPFYLMPTLGGNDSLRGFRDYRFRGPHALLLQGEYRFEIWSGFDAAFFYDAGKVEMERRDLDFSNLESDYGIGFRFNTNNGIILRVDTAFGSRDGKHLWIVFGGTF
jgi:hypothetical protein